MRYPSRKILVLALLLPAAVFSQDSFEEAEKLEQHRQQVFRTQMELLVESLNLGTFDMFVSAIDREDLLKRIYGLRLIDQRLKRDFNDQMEFQFESLVKGGFAATQDEVDATLLGVESRGDQGRALVRYNLKDLQYSYHEYDLRLDENDKMYVVDWVDWLEGDRFTDAVGNSLVMAAPSESAVRKLIDFKNVKESDLFQLRELLKAGRDRNTGRYSEIYRQLNPALHRQRVVVLQNVLLSRAVNNRRYLREALIVMAEHFPDEPLFSLMLLDYYVPTRRYDEAIDALRRTYEKFGFDDAAMEARISALTLAKGNGEDAAALAERAILFDPDLELGWWSALRARVATDDFAGAVEALQKLEESFGHTLGAEQLEGDKSFAPLLASDEFKTWSAAR